MGIRLWGSKMRKDMYEYFVSFCDGWRWVSGFGHRNLSRILRKNQRSGDLRLARVRVIECETEDVNIRELGCLRLDAHAHEFLCIIRSSLLR